MSTYRARAASTGRARPALRATTAVLVLRATATAIEVLMLSPAKLELPRRCSRRRAAACVHLGQNRRHCVRSHSCPLVPHSADAARLKQCTSLSPPITTARRCLYSSPRAGTCCGVIQHAGWRFCRAPGVVSVHAGRPHDTTLSTRTAVQLDGAPYPSSSTWQLSAD